ncbi:MAG: hypothetical protein NTX82_01995 [Candidatus Parcubacteria bacterium]|nr:hypothetical protein [Candidatus Parcubacteria bacterium]
MKDNELNLSDPNESAFRFLIMFMTGCTIGTIIHIGACSLVAIFCLISGYSFPIIKEYLIMGFPLAGVYGLFLGLKADCK